MCDAMMNKLTNWLKNFTLGLCLFTGVTLAQPSYEPNTHTDPAISIDHLDLMLEPLTKEELEAEATAWRNLLKQTVAKISEEEIALRKKNAEITEAQDDETVSEATTEIKKEEKAEYLDDLVELRNTRTALLDRLHLVLDAWEVKGGDAKDIRTYAKAVSGIKVEVTDTSATWSAVKGWVTSDEGGIKWALALAKFLIILLVFWGIANALSSLLIKAVSQSTHVSSLLKNFLQSFFKKMVMFLGLLVALSTIGVKVGALLALVGGSAFILGFALQDTLGNFASGIMLLLYRPFDVGDIVEVGGVFGTVDRVSLVNSTIRTFDNKIVLVPNKQVWGQVITNATASDRRRVDMTFGISYSDDIDKAQSIFLDIVNNHELILKEPAPVVELHTLGESSVDFVCRPWARTGDYWRVYWDVTKAVKMRFDENDVSIPFPQRDVHLYHEVTHSATPSLPPSSAPLQKGSTPTAVLDAPETDDSTAS